MEARYYMLITVWLFRHGVTNQQRIRLNHALEIAALSVKDFRIPSKKEVMILFPDPGNPLSKDEVLIEITFPEAIQGTDIHSVRHQLGVSIKEAVKSVEGTEKITCKVTVPQDLHRTIWC